MTWRTAQTTTDITTGGFVHYQTAYIDSNGNITSFTSGNVDDEIKKYFSPALQEIKYKRSASPLFFLVGNTASYLWDGSSLTEHTHASLGTSFRHAMIFKNEYYVIKGDGTLWKSSNLDTWTDTGVTYAISLATNGNILAVALQGTSIKYSTDGTTFTVMNSWITTPYIVNSIRYLNNQWIAVGAYPESGDFTFRPWVSYSTNISAGWAETLNPYTGTYDTGILDVAWSGSNYLYYVAIASYNAYLYTYIVPGYDLGYGESANYTTNVGYYTTDRSNNVLVATNDGTIVSPIQPYQYMLGLNDYDINDYVYFPGTDRNNDSYFVAVSGSSYMIKDSAYNTITFAPSAVYGVGGSI